MTELHDLAGPYALNALDPAELAEFEAHLASCSSCQTDVADFAETAAELSLLSLSTPPPTLREDILGAIRNTPQISAPTDDTVVSPTAPAGSGTPREPRAAVARRAMPGTEIVDEPDPVPAPVDELALRRQRRRNRVLSGLVAAMLALVVGLGGVVYVLTQQRQAVVAAQGREQQLYSASDATTSTAKLSGGGTVTFIASKQLNRALFIGTDLPNPGASRYQLWTGTGDPTKDNGIKTIARDFQIPVTGSGVKYFFTGDIAESDFMAVNLEPAGSTPERPTVDPLAAGLTA